MDDEKPFLQLPLINGNRNLIFQEILKLYISETEMPPDDVNEVVNKAFKDKFLVPETSLIKKGGNPISSLRFKRITY